MPVEQNGHKAIQMASIEVTGCDLDAFWDTLPWHEKFSVFGDRFTEMLETAWKSCSAEEKARIFQRYLVAQRLKYSTSVVK